MTEKPKSVATILERELKPAIKQWLRQGNLLPALTCILLSDNDRALHLLKLFHDLVHRPLLSKDKRGDFRVTQRPCSLRSQGCSRWLHSKHCNAITSNSIRAICYQTLRPSRTRWISSLCKP